MQTNNTTQSRSLPRSIPSQKTDNFSLFDFQRYIKQGLAKTIISVYSVYFQHANHPNTPASLLLPALCHRRFLPPIQNLCARPPPSRTVLLLLPCHAHITSKLALSHGRSGQSALPFPLSL